MFDVTSKYLWCLQADLLFADCDEGFVPALASLAASSKRPIVLVTNQANSTHLDRFNNSKLLRITFNRPRPNKLSKFVQMLNLNFTLYMYLHRHFLTNLFNSSCCSCFKHSSPSQFISSSVNHLKCTQTT